MFHDIMSAYIIKHNMIIEDEFDTHGEIGHLNVMLICFGSSYDRR